MYVLIPLVASNQIKKSTLILINDTIFNIGIMLWIRAHLADSKETLILNPYLRQSWSIVKIWGCNGIFLIEASNPDRDRSRLRFVSPHVSHDFILISFIVKDTVWIGHKESKKWQSWNL